MAKTAQIVQDTVAELRELLDDLDSSDETDLAALASSLDEISETADHAAEVLAKADETLSDRPKKERAKAEVDEETGEVQEPEEEEAEPEAEEEDEEQPESGGRTGGAGSSGESEGRLSRARQAASNVPHGRNILIGVAAATPVLILTLSRLRSQTSEGEASGS
jgi:hypothetical protein